MTPLIIKPSFYLNQSDQFTLMQLLNYFIFNTRLLIHKKNINNSTYLVFFSLMIFGNILLFILESFALGNKLLSFSNLMNEEIIILFFNNLIFTGGLMYFKRNFIDIYFNDFFANLKIFKGITNDKIILEEFLREKFKHLKHVYFPKMLFEIYNIKHYIHPQLFSIIYPTKYFEGNNIFHKFSLKFHNKLLENTYTYLNSPKNKSEILGILLLNFIFHIIFITTQMTNNNFNHVIYLHFAPIIAIMIIAYFIIRKNSNTKVVIIHKYLFLTTDFLLIIYYLRFDERFLIINLFQSCFTTFLFKYSFFELTSYISLKILITIVNYFIKTNS